MESRTRDERASVPRSLRGTAGVAAMGVAGFVLAAAALVSACTTEEDVTPGPDGGTVRPDGTAPGDGGAREGGEGGAVDAGPPWAVFLGSNYQTGVQIAVVDVGEKKVAGRLEINESSGDVVLAASGGRGFALQRQTGAVIALEQARPWLPERTLPVHDGPDGRSSNPYDVVVATGTKVYVAGYATNLVRVWSGTSSTTVDLSRFNVGSDPDGFVDTAAGLFDPATGRAYFLLQRVDQFDFTGTCLEHDALIVALDTATDQVVDLNGTAAGEALVLRGRNPSAFAADFAGGKIYVLSNGCTPASDGGDAGAAVSGALETVTLSTATSVTSLSVASYSTLVYADPTHAFVRENGTWHGWVPGAATLGAEETNIPAAATSDGRGHLYGIRKEATDGGDPDAGPVYTAVSYDIASKQTTTLVQGLFTVPINDFSLEGEALAR